jgi:hypothetical protein
VLSDSCFIFNMLASTSIFVLNNVLAVIAAEAITTILFSQVEEWRKWLARCTTFILLISADLIITGTFGLLKPLYVLGLMSIFTLLGLIVYKLHQPTTALPEFCRRPKPTVEEHIQRLLAGGFFILFAVGLVARCVYQPPRWFNDDFAYHATNVVQWIRDERFTLGSFNDHAYWPLNHALLPLWLVLPFHADGMAVWKAAPWLILSTIALIGIARAQRMDWSVGLMASAMTAVSPLTEWMLGTFSAADFSGPAMLLAAIAFLAPVQASQERAMSIQTQGSSTSRINVIFAGLASGFAVGTKIPFMIAAFVLGFWILLEKSTDPTERIRRAVLFALGVAITGSYWYVRNWVLTGNPLFPGKVGPFDGPLRLENAQPTLFQWMMRPPLSSAWYEFFGAYIGSWSYGLALLALIALGFAIGHCIKNRSRSILILLIATFLVLLLTHPFMPLSGPYPVDSAYPHFQPRYIIVVFLTGMALTTILLGVNGPMKWVWWACATIACAAAWRSSGSGKMFAALIVAATLLFGLGYFFLYAAAIAGARRLTARCAIVAISACVAAALSSYNQKTVDRYIFEGYIAQSAPSFARVANGWRELETLPSGSRIAWFDNFNWEYYPMYGRRWQLVPVPVNPDGTSFRPLHESWRGMHRADLLLALAGGAPSTAIRSATGLRHTLFRPYRNRDSVSGDELLQNLVRAGVQYVFVSKNRSNTWPAQYEQLERLAGVTRVYNDGYSAIFKIS